MTAAHADRGFARLPPQAAELPEPPAPTPCPRCGRYPFEPCNGAGVAVLGCPRGHLAGDCSRRARRAGIYEKAN